MPAAYVPSLCMQRQLKSAHSLVCMQEVSLSFVRRDANASGAQVLLASLCSSCSVLRALNVCTCQRLEAGPLPSGYSRLRRLSVLQLQNVGVYGPQCLPAALPTSSNLSICDKPASAPSGEMLYPADLTTMTAMSSLKTSRISWEAWAGLPASLQGLTLLLDGWTAAPTLKDVGAFVQLTTVTSLRRLHVSGVTDDGVSAHFTSLMLSLNALRKLKHVTMRECRLQTLPQMSFLRRLTSLDLSHTSCCPCRQRCRLPLPAACWSSGESHGIPVIVHHRHH